MNVRADLSGSSSAKKSGDRLLHSGRLARLLVRVGRSLHLAHFKFGLFLAARSSTVRFCTVGANRPKIIENKVVDGGQGRNRTADASLFRAALYRLSYLAISGGLHTCSFGGTGEDFVRTERFRL